MKTILEWSLLFLLPGVIFIVGLHPFLSINKPVITDVLVVEGWLPKETLKNAAEVFKQGPYKLIITNGGNGRHHKKHRIPMNQALAAQNELIQLGIDAENIIAVEATEIKRSKTYSYAMATIKWLENNHKPINAINVMTLDAHARKSYLLYRKAAKDQVNIGIIASPPVNYRAKSWYISAYGIKYVLGNFVGYLFALTI